MNKANGIDNSKFEKRSKEPNIHTIEDQRIRGSKDLRLREYYFTRLRRIYVGEKQTSPFPNPTVVASLSHQL